MKHLTTKLIASAVMGGCLFAASSSWAAHVVYLHASILTKDLPGKPGVLMWGFGTNGKPATVPGPQISVPDTETTLEIHLRNNLTVPVSIVIPNQNGYVRGAVEPVKFTPAGDTRERAQSFVKETALGAIGVYTWTNVTPGTYLYFSGSHSSLQVQMGLYGAMVRKVTATDIYPLVPAPPTEQVLVFSEIDTKVHDAVAIGNYRDFTKPAWTPADPLKPVMDSTIHSVPDYFLINGQAYIAGQTPLPAGMAGQTVLLRLLNASVNSRIPVIYGLDQTIIAEDGRLYPYPRNLTAPELPALKTMDVLISPATAGTYPLYDRALGLANGTTSPGGMLTYLRVAAPSPTPSPTPVPATAALQKNRTNVAN